MLLEQTERRWPLNRCIMSFRRCRDHERWGVRGMDDDGACFPLHRGRGGEMQGGVEPSFSLQLVSIMVVGRSCSFPNRNMAKAAVVLVRGSLLSLRREPWVSNRGRVIWAMAFA